MKAFLGALAAGLVLGAAANAAPSDYKDRFPTEVTDMKQIRTGEEGESVFAHYEGKAGRASVSILPAPSLAPGETGYDPAAISGETVPAQKVLLSSLLENLQQGTKALGDSYDTSIPKFEPVTLNDENGGKVMDLACASLLRQQATGAEDAMLLLDRICTASKAEDVVVLRMTAPVQREFLDPQNNAQLAFAGEIFQRLLAAD